MQLAHRLRGRDPAAEPALAWLNEHLANRGVRIDAVVHDELQQQGTFTATIRNIITSLRMAAALDWSQVFETVSPVDAGTGIEPATFTKWISRPEPYIARRSRNWRATRPSARQRSPIAPSRLRLTRGHPRTRRSPM